MASRNRHRHFQDAKKRFLVGTYRVQFEDHDALRPRLQIPSHFPRFHRLFPRFARRFPLHFRSTFPRSYPQQEKQSFEDSKKSRYRSERIKSRAHHSRQGPPTNNSHPIKKPLYGPRNRWEDSRRKCTDSQPERATKTVAVLKRTKIPSSLAFHPDSLILDT